MKNLWGDANRRIVFFIWLGWAAILLAYQAYVPARLNLAPRNPGTGRAFI